MPPKETTAPGAAL
jgi:hypothetical protein